MPNTNKIDDTKLSAGNIHYICARNKHQAYNLIIREFKKSGLSKAQLARRLGKRPEIISRLLKMPQNWELDTFSELLYGISGAAVKFLTDYPASAPKPVYETNAPSTETRAHAYRVISQNAHALYIPPRSNAVNTHKMFQPS